MRRVVPLLATVWMVLSLLPAGDMHAQSPRQGPPADGPALYRTHCASCHGTSGRGDGPAADAMRRRPSDLTQFAKTNGGVFPSAKTERIIDGRDVGAHGSVEMPVWGDVFQRTLPGDAAGVAARIAALVRHLESLQERTGECSRAVS